MLGNEHSEKTAICILFVEMDLSDTAAINMLLFEKYTGGVFCRKPIYF